MGSDSMTEPPKPLFLPRTPLCRIDDVEYVVETLTRQIARSHVPQLLKLHNIIPLVEPWSEEILLSDRIEGREFAHKWALSCVIRRATDDEIVGILISYLRLSSPEHPLDSIYIHRLSILDNIQRRKIGTCLLEKYIESLFNRIPWLKNITVQTTTTDLEHNVTQFYIALGFTKVCNVEYEGKTDILLLRSRRLSTVGAFDPLVEHPRLDSALVGLPRVFLATTNPRKAGELSFLFGAYNVEVEAAKSTIELTEPQIEGNNPDLEARLVHHPLRLAARFLEKRSSLPFIVEDTMLYIEFFNRDYDLVADLPGYDTKRWWRQLGAEGVLSLMGSTPKR